MANKRFEVDQGFKIGGVVIDEDTSSITTTGNISVSGAGKIASSVMDSPVVKGGKSVVVNLGALSTGTTTINLTAAQVFTATIAASAVVTFAFSNPPAAGEAQMIVLRLTNAGAGTIIWPAGTKYAGGALSSLTTSGIDMLGVFYDTTTSTYMVFVLGKDMK